MFNNKFEDSSIVVNSSKPSGFFTSFLDSPSAEFLTAIHDIVAFNVR